MARIIINIKQKTRMSKAYANIRLDYGNRDTTAERNLMLRIYDSICTAWTVGNVEAPPEQRIPNLDLLKGKEEQ